MKTIKYKDHIISLTNDGHDTAPVTYAMYDKLREIQYGKMEHPWSVVIND